MTINNPSLRQPENPAPTSIKDQPERILKANTDIALCNTMLAASRAHEEIVFATALTQRTLIVVTDALLSKVAQAASESDSLEDFVTQLRRMSEILNERSLDELPKAHDEQTER